MAAANRTRIDIAHHLLIKYQQQGSNQLLLSYSPQKSIISSFHSFINNNNGPSSSSSSSISIYAGADNNNKVNNNLLNDCFDKMISIRPLPSVDKFCRLLDDVRKMKQYYCSLDFFKQMCAVGVPVDNYTASIIIKCYCRLGQSKLGFTVLGCCFKQGIEPHVSTYNTLLKGFIREDKTHEAERLFSKLIQNRLWEPDVVTYNTMIQGLCKIGDNYKAIALLRLMDHGRAEDGCKPDVVSYNTVIHSLCNDIIMIDDAFRLFNEMVFHKAIPPNALTYSSLIYALSKLGRWDEVFRMLKQMEDANIFLGGVKTFNIIVDVLCKQGKINEAELVINIMLETAGKYLPDIGTYNSLIEGYYLRGEMSKAKRILDSLPSRGVEPNIVTYNKLLYRYSKDSKMNEACDMYDGFFKTGPKTGPKPNTATSFIMLGVTRRHQQTAACKPTLTDFPCEHVYQHYLKHHISTYEEALDMFHFMDDNCSNLNSNIDVYNILIDGAIKWGKFDMARHLFHHLFLQGLKPDVETNRVMINGFCREHLFKHAKQLFLKSEKSHCPPNSIIADDLVHAYLKNKPFNDAHMLFQELMDRSYTISASNSSLVLDQLIARDPQNTLIKLVRDVMPKEWDYVPGPTTPSRYIYDDPFGTRLKTHTQKRFKL